MAGETEALHNRWPDSADSELPKPLRDLFLDRAHRITVRKGQILIAEGALQQEVFLICDGEVQISRISPQGREIILRSLGPNCLFGELSAIDGQPRSAQVVALVNGRLAAMSGERFVAYLGEIPLAGLWMAQQLAARVRDLTEKAFDLVTLPVAGRVQSELLRMAASVRAEGEAPDSIVIRPAPTHGELAARTGTHREAVSRELGLLAQEGILRQSGRTLEILSLPALQKLYDRFRR